MSRCNGWAILAMILTPVVFAADDPAKEELKKLQGTWEFTSAVSNGKEFPVEGCRLLIVDEVIKFESGKEANSARLKLLSGDDKVRPFDAEVLDGVEKGKTRLAIYELDGDTLIICWSRTNKRPEKFESQKGDGFLLITLKRKP